MSDFNWSDEPDLEEFRLLYTLLSTRPEEALFGLTSLADRGSIASMFYLADAYKVGERTSKDLNLAKYWYERAEQMGSAPASYMLGRVFLLLQEYVSALAAFSRGADRQYPPAMYRLAKMYQCGVGTDKNMVECRRLLEAAVARGHIFSKRDLATLFIRGEFGTRLVFRGALMLMSLIFDIVGLVAKAIRRGPLDERILA